MNEGILSIQYFITKEIAFLELRETHVNMCITRLQRIPEGIPVQMVRPNKSYNPTRKGYHETRLNRQNYMRSS